MGTTVSLEKEVSCRVTNSVIKYVESLGYNTDCLVEGLQEKQCRMVRRTL